MKILNGNIMKTMYELKRHRKYKVVLLGSVYEGTMVKLYPTPDVIKMRNVTLFGISNKKFEFSFFSKEFEFYDVEEIRDNSIRAKQQMEQRSLRLILKRLINEDFVW